MSISNNIAEGFDRKTNKDFAHFLFISKGSCAEVRSMLHLANKLNMIDEKTSNELINKTNEISKMLAGLINTLN